MTEAIERYRTISKDRKTEEVSQEEISEVKIDEISKPNVQIGLSR